MSQSIEETLRKSRQIDQKFKAFMIKKEQNDKSMAKTMKSIRDTQETLRQSKNTIMSIQNMYEQYQKKFDDAINLALQSVQKSVLLEKASSDWVETHISPKEFVKELQSKKQIMFLTGSGMSVASGIPTFRGVNGFWTKQGEKGEKEENSEKLAQHERMMTLKYLAENQWEVWKWLVNLYQIINASKPNKGHTALHAIMKEIVGAKKKGLLVTQNIDQLHCDARDSKTKKNQKGSELYNIYEIHGNINKLRCDSCGQAKKQAILYSFQKNINKLKQKENPLCPKCSQKLRPHIMFFDEFYNEMYNHFQSIKQYTKDLDMLVVLGTTLKTGLARQIVENALNKNILIVQINIECQVRRPNTKWMVGKSENILEQIKLEIWKAGL